ncbi:MAG: hypothetical protein E7Z94_06500 [Actinomyces ruminicola]|nr:hypothetical protein [Actinomyces ruminicola]
MGRCWPPANRPSPARRARRRTRPGRARRRTRPGRARRGVARRRGCGQRSRSSIHLSTPPEWYLRSRPGPGVVRNRNQVRHQDSTTLKYLSPRTSIPAGFPWEHRKARSGRTGSPWTLLNIAQPAF